LLVKETALFIHRLTPDGILTEDAETLNENY